MPPCGPAPPHGVAVALDLRDPVGQLVDALRQARLERCIDPGRIRARALLERREALAHASLEGSKLRRPGVSESGQIGHRLALVLHPREPSRQLGDHLLDLGRLRALDGDRGCDRIQTLLQRDPLLRPRALRIGRIARHLQPVALERLQPLRQRMQRTSHLVSAALRRRGRRKR